MPLSICVPEDLSDHAGPMHKRNFALKSGECLNDNEFSIITFDVRTDGDDVLLLLPEPAELDAVIGTSKWMVKQATTELVNSAGEESSIEVVGPNVASMGHVSCDTEAVGCNESNLSW